MDDLEGAVARLRRFRQSWNAGDEIDEDSKLTAGDLDAILTALERETVVPADAEAGFATNGE